MRGRPTKDPHTRPARITVKRRQPNKWFKRGTYIGGRWTCSGPPLSL